MKKQSSDLFNMRDGVVSLLRMSLIKATGTDICEAMQRPLIGVVNSQTDLNPGHMHLGTLAQRVKDGIHAAGGIPFEFNVPAPCDGMTEGHDGMCFVLPQRELIADLIEVHVRSMRFDGLVLVASCDKILPAMMMAAVRLDLPAIFLTGGPNAWQIRTNPNRKKSVDAKEYAGTPELVDCCTAASCGACEVMGTANTFQCLAEAMGLVLPGSANVPGSHPEKQVLAYQTGRRIVAMIQEDLTVRKILTREALHNALMADLAIGGSTNSTLHLPAIAHEIGFEFPLSLFNDYNRRIPTLLSISPNGPHGIIDLYAAGGMPAVLKMLSQDLFLDAMTVMGRPLAEIVSAAEVKDVSVIRTKDAPYLPEGGTAVLYGNLAPEGAVIKQSAVAADMRVFSGKARVFESERDALAALDKRQVQEGDVVIIRNAGPIGGPGMPETLAVTLALTHSALKRVALITDGRFSGATDGPCVGHISPEACVGGPIAGVVDGDIITIDIPNRTLSAQVDLSARLTEYRQQKHTITNGYMRRYVKSVSSAARGAVVI